MVHFHLYPPFLPVFFFPSFGLSDPDGFSSRLHSLTSISKDSLTFMFSWIKSALPLQKLPGLGFWTVPSRHCIPAGQPRSIQRANRTCLRKLQTESCGCPSAWWFAREAAWLLRASSCRRDWRPSESPCLPSDAGREEPCIRAVLVWTHLARSIDDVRRAWQIIDLHILSVILL